MDGKLTDELRAKIDAMSREQMASLGRFAPVGSPYFVGETGDYFRQRFTELGGMSPSISKSIGW